MALLHLPCNQIPVTPSDGFDTDRDTDFTSPADGGSSPMGMGGPHEEMQHDGFDYEDDDDDDDDDNQMDDMAMHTNHQDDRFPMLDKDIDDCRPYVSTPLSQDAKVVTPQPKSPVRNHPSSLEGLKCQGEDLKRRREELDTQIQKVAQSLGNGLFDLVKALQQPLQEMRSLLEILPSFPPDTPVLLPEPLLTSHNGEFQPRRNDALQEALSKCTKLHEDGLAIIHEFVEGKPLQTLDFAEALVINSNTPSAYLPNHPAYNNDQCMNMRDMTQTLDVYDAAGALQCLLQVEGEGIDENAQNNALSDGNLHIQMQQSFDEY
ncbi:hypothetical protein ED733_008752 [Metarhizium rileyi]|uniref:Uncharacterized protein n=1 Tax=Metarhizium rileyi (strain RCEF 4871) TaxID=1649241 RepID=A0A5C6GMU5_METRR|nr:hypothetical protein ED733_008752 [Metarhizium rileyi]